MLLVGSTGAESYDHDLIDSQGAGDDDRKQRVQIWTAMPLTRCPMPRTRTTASQREWRGKWTCTTEGQDSRSGWV